MFLESVLSLSDLSVLYKPCGMTMHQSDAEDDEQSVESVLGQQFSGYARPAHRLDKGTSGLLLVAHTSEALSKASKMFELREIEKEYLAISASKPKKKQGVVRGDMLPARRGNYKLSPTYNNPAKTRFTSYTIGEGRRLFLLRPFTGKTHQLRVALKSVSAPILGDARYGGASGALESVDRMYLHAYGLSFIWDGVQQRVYVSPKEGALFQLPAVLSLLDTFRVGEGD